MDKSPYWKDALVAFVRISGWIVVPVVAALFAGRWLDAKYGTAPYLFLGAVGLAFLVTVLGIMKEVRRYQASSQKPNGKQ